MSVRVWLVALGLALVALALVLLRPSPAPPGASFDGQRAYAHVQAQCGSGPRTPGSAASLAVAQYIVRELQGLGWQAKFQEFDYRGERLRNVVATRGRAGQPSILLGAHYDTRRHADQDRITPSAPVPGADDGASGVAVLLELARVLGEPTRPLTLAFFDGEDQGELNGWEWGVGATHLAANLDGPVASMLLVDMVGDADQQLYWEETSDRALRERLWAVAAELGYSRWFIPASKYSMLDDHTPFLRRGIPAVDIIDFDYPYWHTTSDTPDKVSPDSLQRVGRVLEVFLK